MKKLEVLGKFYEAEKIIKEPSSITGYVGNLEVFTFRGITDFSLFKLTNGDMFDLDENTLLKERLKSTEEALIFLMEMKLQGGE